MNEHIPDEYTQSPKKPPWAHFWNTALATFPISLELSYLNKQLKTLFWHQTSRCAENIWGDVSVQFE